MLPEAREALADTLSGVLGDTLVVADWPVLPHPPLAVVVPARGAFIARAPFGEWSVFLDVVLLVARTRTSLADLEILVENVLTLPGYDITGVDGPSAVSPGDVGAGATEMLGTLVHLNTLAKIGA